MVKRRRKIKLIALQTALSVARLHPEYLHLVEDHFVEGIQEGLGLSILLVHFFVVSDEPPVVFDLLETVTLFAVFVEDVPQEVF